MSVLDTLDFRPMLIVDMFRPHKGKRLVAAHRQPGMTPFVGGSESYNSITGFSDVDPLFPGGWITLVYNGSVGQTRLQPAPFFASDDVIALEPIAKNVSEAALLVCCAIIQRECVNKYSYGSKLNLQRLNRQTVMVPTTVGSDGTIETDWDGMDRLGAELLEQVAAHAHSARETRSSDDDTLPELRFEPMFITDVFDSMKPAGKWFDLAKAERHGSPVSPYVARSGESNGIGAFLPLQSYDAPNAGNAITIGVSTSTVFYQPVKFYTSKEIQVLRHPRLGPDNALVLVALLREQMMKFQWGNGASIARLQATRIMVPVVTNAEGEDVVDWEGMSAYGRALRVRAERAIAPVIGDPS
jgi:conserved domain protein